MRTQALGRPWAITEDGLRLVLAVATRREAFAEALAARRADVGERREGGRHEMAIENGVAVIKVLGPLLRHADLMCDISGATSYGAIRRQMQAAIGNPACSAILLKVDSPGGEANGCGDLAAQIRQWSAQKPVVAYVEGYGASAAYWLASAASKIYCAPTAFLGSIGVRSAILDDSDAMADQGLREIEIVSSQSPDKRGTPVDDALIAREQARVDDLAAVFVAAVAKYRGVKESAVLADFGKGDHMIGGKAVDAGLADAIGDYAAAMEAARAAAARAPVKKTQAGALPVRRTTMKTLVERLTALAGQTAERGDSFSAELTDIAAGVSRLQDDNATLKAQQVAQALELDGHRIEAAIRTGWTERRITSPAQEAAVRGAYAGDLPGLQKYLSLQQPAPALERIQPRTGPKDEGEDAARKANADAPAGGLITRAFGGAQ